MKEGKLLLILSLLLYNILFAADLHAAPVLHVEVTLTATWLPDVFTGTESPVVNSYARTFLYDSSTGIRIYRHVILDHGVFDLNAGRTIFTGRLDSANGYISNSTGNLSGQANNCYSAVATGHANDFNLHRTAPSPTDCVPPPPEKPEKPVIPDENSPILLDLDQDGFHLSGPNPPVSFDINADGVPDQIAWTTEAGDDAFLCLDRNQNGVIDDGTELFGYATPLLSGKRARVGYRALAELDQPELGGNSDGKITRGDVLFRSLCVWNDLNRNGESEPGEIQRAEEAGVVSLDYGYRVTKIQDGFGNLFRYVSSAEMRTAAGKIRSWPTFDVIFAGFSP